MGGCPERRGGSPHNLESEGETRARGATCHLRASVYDRNVGALVQRDKEFRTAMAECRPATPLLLLRKLKEQKYCLNCSTMFLKTDTPSGPGTSATGHGLAVTTWFLKVHFSYYSNTLF